MSKLSDLIARLTGGKKKLRRRNARAVRGVGPAGLLGEALDESERRVGDAEAASVPIAAARACRTLFRAADAACHRVRRMRRVADFELTADAAGETAALTSGELEHRLEQHRQELTAYCYRMLASAFDAEDAVQETFIRAWRGFKGFEGRAALRSWLYRIATNVCLDMLNGRERRARPMDLGPSQAPIEANLNTLPETTWIQPVPDGLVVADGDPADVAVARETIRLAFVAALQHLPPRQRAVLILCEVLRWQATEVAELLDTSVASVNSALQRARATLAAGNVSTGDPSPPLDADNQALLARYVEAFERYDMEALTSVIQDDATQSMPPYDLWLRGRDDILAWWVGPGAAAEARGSSRRCRRMARRRTASTSRARRVTGYDPWALQVIEVSDGQIGEITFFLDTDTIFPLFGLPPRLEA